MGGDEPSMPKTAELLLVVQRFLDRLTVSGPLLIAFSGGGDSTALLLALAEALDAYPQIRLHAATVDHGLRDGSAKEAFACGEFASALGISHEILRWQGSKPLTGIQAAAREARYRLLEAEAHRIGAVAILTAHNRDDQIETILMRRERGEGEGLSGMAPAVLLQSRTWLLRPLLGIPRETLREALRENRVGWIEDPSNDNLKFERVRVRNAAHDPQAVDPDRLARQRETSAHAQAGWLKDHAIVFGRVVARITTAGVKSLAEPEATLALFKLAAALSARAFLPPSESRARILDALRSEKPGRMTLAGLVFDRRASGLYLYREARGAYPNGRADETAAISALIKAGVPDAIAKRAAPWVSSRHGTEASSSRQIAAYARFLPCFELPVAERLNALFGLPCLPVLPLRTDEAATEQEAARLGGE